MQWAQLDPILPNAARDTHSLAPGLWITERGGDSYPQEAIEGVEVGRGGV